MVPLGGGIAPPHFVDEGSEGEEKWCEALRALAGVSARPATRRMCGPVSWSLLSALLVLLICSRSPFFPSPRMPLLSSKVCILTRCSDLQVTEDYPKGGCKNGYLRHMDSSILDDGTHKPGCPGGDQSVEGGELLNLLAPFFNEKATLLLESR